MHANPDAWSRDSFLAVHNWWHVSLFYLAINDVGEALELYDAANSPQKAPPVLEMIDASALLWRLKRRM